MPGPNHNFFYCHCHWYFISPYPQKVVFETQKLSQKCPLVYTGAGAPEMFVASAHRFQDGLPISDFIMRILLLTKDFFFLADRGC